MELLVKNTGLSCLDTTMKKTVYLARLSFYSYQQEMFVMFV